MLYKSTLSCLCRLQDTLKPSMRSLLQGAGETPLINVSLMAAGPPFLKYTLGETSLLLSLHGVISLRLLQRHLLLYLLQHQLCIGARGVAKVFDNNDSAANDYFGLPNLHLTANSQHAGLPGTAPLTTDRA